MAKIERLIEQARTQLGFEGDVLAAVAGVYESKGAGGKPPRNGVLIATHEQLFFFAKKLIGYDSESFAYDQISSIQVGKTLIGHHVSFHLSSGTHVQMKWIVQGDFQQFVRAVTSRTAPSASPAVAVTASERAAPASSEDSASAAAGGTLILVCLVVLGLWWTGFISFGRTGEPDGSTQPAASASSEAQGDKPTEPGRKELETVPTPAQKEAEAAARLKAQARAEAEARKKAAEDEKREARERRKQICEDDHISAYIMTQDAVRSRLRAPRSAEFPSFGDRGVRVTNEDGCSYGVAAFVDSQNGFGAMVRSAYIAKIRAHLDGTWTVEALTVLN